MLHNFPTGWEQVLPLFLLALFIGVPLLEIAVFIEVGGRIGLGWTLVVVVATALLGTFLLRRQGFATLRSAQQSMDRGALPMRELFDGLCLLFAGALLLTPGFVTDAVGFALFLPPVRDGLRRLVGRHLQVHMAGGAGPGGTGPGGEPPDWSAPGGAAGRENTGRGGPVIDGDFREVPPADRDTGRGEPGGDAGRPVKRDP